MFLFCIFIYLVTCDESYKYDKIKAGNFDTIRELDMNTTQN